MSTPFRIYQQDYSMATRQRTRSPRKSSSSQQPAGEALIESTQPSDGSALNATFEPRTFDESQSENAESTDVPKATFVGEQLIYADRGARIAEAAYFRAQQRGFTPGYELEDWLAAEKEVAALFDSEQGSAAKQ
jgi:Protein of unknown function (DUF2934)